MSRRARRDLLHFGIVVAKKLIQEESRFDFCAECLGSFITDNLGRTEKDEELPLGFTVSTGVMQTVEEVWQADAVVDEHSQFSYPCSCVCPGNRLQTFADGLDFD